MFQSPGLEAKFSAVHYDDIWNIQWLRTCFWIFMLRAALGVKKEIPFWAFGEQER